MSCEPQGRCPPSHVLDVSGPCSAVTIQPQLLWSFVAPWVYSVAKDFMQPSAFGFAKTKFICLASLEVYGISYLGLKQSPTFDLPP